MRNLDTHVNVPKYAHHIISSNLTKCRAEKKAASTVIIAAANTILSTPEIWTAPDTDGTPQNLFEQIYPLNAQWLLRRVLVDSLLTPEVYGHIHTTYMYTHIYM